MSHFLLTAIAIQCGLVLLAMLIRALDSKEVLVKAFHLPQSDPSGPGDFKHAMHHYKSTYYLASVLISLFFVGLAYVMHLCVTSCDCAPGHGGGSGHCCQVDDPSTVWFAGRGCDGC